MLGNSRSTINKLECKFSHFGAVDFPKGESCKTTGCRPNRLKAPDAARKSLPGARVGSFPPSDRDRRPAAEPQAEPNPPKC